MVSSYANEVLGPMRKRHIYLKSDAIYVAESRFSFSTVLGTNYYENAAINIDTGE